MPRFVPPLHSDADSARKLGRADYKRGEPIDSNPFDGWYPEGARYWREGWIAAAEDAPPCRGPEG